jgi:hypothetical protein
MRRKDYEVVAGAIASLPLDPGDQDSVVAALCAAFAQENPRFDPEKFRRAALREPDAPGYIDPDTLTRILIDYLVGSSKSGDLPTLSSIVDVARESALGLEPATRGPS